MYLLCCDLIHLYSCHLNQMKHDLAYRIYTDRVMSLCTCTCRLVNRICIRYSQLNKQIICKDKHWFGLVDIYGLNPSQGSIGVYNCRQLNVMHPCINSIIIRCNSIRVGSICQTPDQMLSELYSLQTRSILRLCSVSTVYYICRVSGLLKLKLLKKIDYKKSKFNYYQ